MTSLFESMLVAANIKIQLKRLLFVPSGNNFFFLKGPETLFQRWFRNLIKFWSKFKTNRTALDWSNHISYVKF